MDLSNANKWGNVNRRLIDDIMHVTGNVIKVKKRNWVYTWVNKIYSLNKKKNSFLAAAEDEQEKEKEKDPVKDVNSFSHS